MNYRSNKILFAGDPHGNFRPLIDIVQKQTPEAVILLGDYDLEQPLENYLEDIITTTQIWWIAGNHDFESPHRHKNLFHSALATKELHLKVTDIAGLKIAGVGGIFLGRVWYPPQTPKWHSKQEYLQTQPANVQQTGLPLKYQSAIWHDEIEVLKTLKADILVTHEAPGSHRHGFKLLDEVAVAMGVTRIFHGHLHESYVSVVRKNIKVCGVADCAVVDMLGNRL